MTTETPPPFSLIQSVTQFIQNLTPARVAVTLAVSALAVNAPRLVISFLNADGLELWQPIEGLMLGVTGIATGVVLSGGGAYIAHKIGAIKKFDVQNPLHIVLVAVWVLMLLFSVVIIAPLMVQGVLHSSMKDVLPNWWQQWFWGIVAVAAPEVLAAGAMIAAALNDEPTVASEDVPAPAWENALGTLKSDLETSLLRLSQSIEQLAITGTERNAQDAALYQAVLDMGQNITLLTQALKQQRLTDGQSDQATRESITALIEVVTELKTSLAAPKLTHVCNDCGQGFTSASALGGHRSRCTARPIPATSNGHGGNHD